MASQERLQGFSEYDSQKPGVRVKNERKA